MLLLTGSRTGWMPSPTLGLDAAGPEPRPGLGAGPVSGPGRGQPGTW
jgi:hypothetical protein